MCGYGKGSYRVACREGEPCPAYGAAVEKIKTGSTSGYISPRCQPLKVVSWLPPQFFL